jgi:phosphoribosylformimino-5-aminoimidazole carboxamide ribotide isomerase
VASRAAIDASATHRAFATLGFRQIHLHDLDADSGRDQQNEALIAEIARDASIEVLVSGGSLSDDRVDRLMDAGVAYVIVGPQREDDIDTLGRIADSFPGRLIVRADFGDPLFTRRGTRRHDASDMIDLANELASFHIGGLAVHALSSDGFPGASLRCVEDLVEAATVPVFCRTESPTLGELRALEHLGVAAVMLGSSLFNGLLDARAVVHYFDA